MGRMLKPSMKLSNLLQWQKKITTLNQANKLFMTKTGFLLQVQLGNLTHLFSALPWLVPSKMLTRSTEVDCPYLGPILEEPLSPLMMMLAPNFWQRPIIKLK